MPRKWWNTWYLFGIISWAALTHATPVKANGMTQPNPCNTDGCSTKIPPANKVVEAPMTYVPAVSELVDETPTDWEVQAMLSLASRYGILLGFPDRTFRSNRPVTRYEFAVALNQVLNQVNTLIANKAAGQFSQEDLITLQRLQRDYNSVLQEIRTQLDTLSDRTNELTSTQFSTTTKLNGEVILGFTDGTNANATVVSRQRLNLFTSFSPQDLLLTQLEAGNRGQDAISVAHNREQNLLGTSGLLADGGGLEYTEIDETLSLRRLYYTFRPSADLAVTLGAKMSPSDFIDRNRSANNPAVDFSSSFLINNPLIVQNQIDREGGAGAAVAWNINGSAFTVRSLYIAADGNQPNSTTPTQGGLFSDRYQGSVELEYSSSANLAVRLQYTNAVINNTDIQAAGINAEYAFNRNAAVYGRFGFGSYQGFNTAVNQELDLNPTSWAVGLTVRNLAIPGTIAGIAFGQPFIEDDLGNATQTNVEAFYNLTLSENISVTPAVQLVKHANNDRSSGTIWQGTLRTVFSF
ncbi:iron uptake porin [Gloeocapsopsis sp. IPPAS B-1203]|uniref:iron uptake porin n=1 Tax=Gloeocapsopsis sp. IPPAS B-1203 TaxID=2049454 RepID=UPI000C184117|nr:iron uptake porin [Gloeocapsopsis sp. IPPAS B-1203]PIG90527.1 porin [Gloeocapsopsis sp. IPPAS B-1203]